MIAAILWEVFDDWFRPGGCRVSESDSDVLLTELARGVTSARIDLTHFPVVYYFAPYDPDASLARWTRHLTRIASDAGATHRPAHVRLAAVALDSALHDLSVLLDHRFVRAPDRDRDHVFAAYARDHQVEVA